VRAKKWIAFRGDGAAFDYAGTKLQQQWSRLHATDCEPYPSPQALAARLGGDEDAEAAARDVADAWRAFHRGEFHRAHELAGECGLAGCIARIKAAGVYASYLERNDEHAQALLLDASKEAEEAIEKLPKDPNAHYLLAFTLGRYSQRISIAEALVRGLAGKVESALTRALKLEPRHVEAHIALGLYHAEITARLGSLAAGLSYGASATKAIEHFKKAQKLAPHVAIVRLEFAHALRLLDRRQYAEQIDDLIAAAEECEPLDAVQWMDREQARKRAAER
jgi:tetratricopeptide (TPR) repeat protein